MLVILSLVLVPLLGAMALAIDVGLMYFNWEQLQKATDAAVLSGANYLPDNSSQAQTTATNYAESNGVAATEIVSVQVAPDNLSISMTASRQVPWSFARVLGLTTATLTASSTAAVPYGAGSIGGGGGRTGYGSSIGSSPLVPIGLDYKTPYVHGQAVALNQGSVGAGNWGSIALGGVGGANERSNIANGYYGQVSVGDWLTTEPGKKVGPIDQGFGDRLSAGLTNYPSGSFTSYSLNDPRIVVMPMVDWSTASGRSSVAVKGFAALWVDSVSGGTINAHFISTVVIGGQPNASAPNDGAVGQPVLIK